MSCFSISPLSITDCKPSERTQPRLCHSNPVSQPKGAVRTPSPACWGRWRHRASKDARLSTGCGAGWGMARCFGLSRIARPSPQTCIDSYLLSAPHPPLRGAFPASRRRGPARLFPNICGCRALLARFPPAFARREDAAGRFSISSTKPTEPRRAADQLGSRLKVGLHDRHRKPASIHTCFPHPIRRYAAPSPLRGEGGPRQKPACSITCVNAAGCPITSRKRGNRGEGVSFNETREGAKQNAPLTGGYSGCLPCSA